jgi:hypothetical protein
VIYDHPKNAALKRRRPNPNILYPGDRLFIPDKQEREEARGTGRRHQFVVQQPSRKIRVVLRDEFGKALSGIKYRLRGKGVHTQVGKLPSDGAITADVPLGVERVSVRLLELNIEYSFRVGHLDPVSRTTGVQQRLTNLGFAPGPVDGVVGSRTRAALVRFQAWAGLPQTGVADAKTRWALEAAHEGRTHEVGLEDAPGVAPVAVEVGKPGG